MKKTLLALIGAGALAACTPTPTSAPEMRQVVNQGAMMTEKNSFVVSRSLSAVTSSLRRGSDRCLTTTTSQGIMARGPMGMGHMQQIGRFYQTDVKSNGRRAELVMKMSLSGAIMIGGDGNGTGVVYVADATPVSGGTRIDTYGAKMGNEELNAAIKRWASGGNTLPCPQLP